MDTTSWRIFISVTLFVIFSLTCTGISRIKNHAVSTSFGVKSDAPNPMVFLRKGSRATNIPLVEHHNQNKELHKPAVPSRDDRPVQGLKTAKNYITCNAIESINGSPKRRKDEEVCLHDEYGKVPVDLMSVKAAMEEEKQLVEMYIAEQYGSPKAEETQVMGNAERIELINKLKQRWDDMNSIYQKYCHKVMLDTPGEIKRKASQEAKLKQLEHDIEMLSCPGPLMIRK